MALGSITLTQLLVVLVVVVLLFGTRRLATIGEDLGTALKGFRKAVNEPEPPAAALASPSTPASMPASMPAPTSVVDVADIVDAVTSEAGKQDA
jgi:TatA/E family protein of Tat protein translocase